jgi:ubiquinone/menaquinone biosynthesis C-methylase UbiE
VSSYDAIAPVYDDWSAHMSADVDFYVSLAAESAGPVVELAVGNGRVAVPIAQRTGRRVIGIDASAAMLESARARADAAGVQLDLRHGDMRELALDEPTDLVICPFRSLLHLPTWADRRRVFERVAATLVPGGRFAWNSFAFDPLVAAEHSGRWEEQNGVRHRVDHVPADSRIDITIAGRGTISLHWVTRSEWDGLVDVAGLEVEALYGWFDRSPLHDDSRELVYVVRKPS